MKKKIKTVLILGASRGIGFEFARQYHAAGWRVIATARSAAGLEQLNAEGAITLALDLQDAASIAAAAVHLKDEKLDLCICNAGVVGPRESGIFAPPEEEFDLVMHTNVLGAMRIVPVVAPLVAAAGGKLAFLSSRMGSVSLMASTAAMLYRASKAALNAIVQGTAIEWGPKGVAVIALHPGWVKTEMGGKDADITVETSVSGMRNVIENLSAGKVAQYQDYSGAVLSW